MYFVVIFVASEEASDDIKIVGVEDDIATDDDDCFSTLVESRETIDAAVVCWNRLDDLCFVFVSFVVSSVGLLVVFVIHVEMVGEVGTMNLVVRGIDVVTKHRMTYIHSRNVASSTSLKTHNITRNLTVLAE